MDTQSNSTIAPAVQIYRDANIPLPMVKDGVIGGHPVKMVDGREVHRFLKVGKDYSSWMKDRIKKYGFIENVDYVVFTDFGENPDGGRPPIEYHLTIGMGKELGMVDRSAQGRAIRKYFISIEERQAAQTARPVSLAELALQNAQALVDMERRHAEQQAEISAQRAEITAAREEIAEIRQTLSIFDKVPANGELITHLRARIRKELRLSDKVINQVLDASPYGLSPKFGVRNPREEAQGGVNYGYLKREVNMVFRRFISECRQVNATQWEHDYIEGRFRIAPKK